METLELTLTLTPSQKRAADKLLKSLVTGPVTVLWGAAGMGRTTILEQIQAAHEGAVLVETSEFFPSMVVLNRYGIAFDNWCGWLLASGQIVHAAFTRSSQDVVRPLGKRSTIMLCTVAFVCALLLIAVTRRL